MSASPLLEAHVISKRFQGAAVLEAVSMRIMPNEIVTLIGPNGAGKTTLLKCLLGLEVPDSGTLTRHADLRIGYMPQQFQPPTTMPMTVVGFLELFAPKSGVPSALLASLEIAALMLQQLSTLSGGELRRVLLARALLNRPNLLVLDEPTQGIDVNGQNEFYQHIARMPELHGCAVLMVSHDLHVVMASTHRVICLNRHICCEGAPKAVGNAPAFRQLFGDALASQLALYQHHHTHAHDLHGDVVPLDTHTHHEGCTHG